ICIIEAGAELFEKVMQPCVPMGLHHGNHLSFGTLARGTEHSRDLDRMMPVIVNNCRSIPFADERKSSFNSTKIGKRIADCLALDSKRVRDGNGGGRIERVMPTRHREGEVVDRVRNLSAAITEQNRKARLAVEMIEICESHVGLMVFSVGENAPIFQLADQ